MPQVDQESDSTSSHSRIHHRKRIRRAPSFEAIPYGYSPDRNINSSFDESARDAMYRRSNPNKHHRQHSYYEHRRRPNEYAM